MNDAVHIPRPAEDHPLIDDLVAFVDGELDDAAAQIVAAHLEGCTACQQTIATVAGPIAIEPLDVDQLVHGRRFAVLAPLRVTGEPLPGEVWQLDWEDNAVAAVVLEPDETGALVGVVTQDRPESEHAAQLTLADLDVTLWIQPILAHVPLGVFRYPLANASETLDAIRARFETPPSPIEVPDGTRPSPVDPLQRADLSAAVLSLAIASWIPTATNEPLALGDLMREHRRPPSDVAEATGIAAAELTALVRGTRQATAGEAEALAAVFGVPAERLQAPVSFPDDLVRAVERPVLRAAIEARAIDTEVSEATSRLRTAEAVHAMAARTTRGERDVDTWTELIRQYLDA